MRVSKAFLIAAAASLAATPLAAQEANDTAYAENVAAADPAAPDANAVDANAVDANLVAAPVDDTVLTEETVETEPRQTTVTAASRGACSACLVFWG